MMIAVKGKSLELEQPQYFVDGRGTLQARKGSHPRRTRLSLSHYTGGRTLPP